MSKMYHIGLDDSLNVKYAILPGDPGRVAKIAEYLDEPKKLAESREYTSYVGYLEGEKVLVVSTGMGGPSTAIAIEELAQIGVTTCIRVGSTGGIDLKVKGGDLVIANSTIRMEGTSKEYVPIEFPATANFEVTLALIKAAQKSNRNFHVGTIHTKDSFYGQHSPERMPVSYELLNKWEAWKKAGTLASEMECAALFTVSQVLGIRSGAVLHVLWNKDRVKAGMEDNETHDMSEAIKVSIEAIRLLIESDKSGKKIYE